MQQITDYPRPQFVRNNWVNLNGSWDFAFDDANAGIKAKWYSTFPKTQAITVPYTYETEASGIHDETIHNYVWYHRTFTVTDEMITSGKRLILHFEGSDFHTSVWVNGTFVGMHQGGYARFSFDITDSAQKEKNAITVRVADSSDTEQPRGKQRWIPENFGCWYVQTTGIWKTVWLESVGEVSLSKVKMTPCVSDGTIQLDYEVNAPETLFGPDLQIQADISFQGTFINSISTAILERHSSAYASLFFKDAKGFEWAVKLWTPENPDLYDIRFTVRYKGTETDCAASYFGMREIRLDGANILLNGRPLYQRLILDQGYWKDTHLTPPTEEALKVDVEYIKALGYNGVRKHQKIEDERFLYWCDVSGLLVWSEMPAAYRFTDYAVAEFTREWLEIIDQQYNHPAIITWTPFNESWGVAQIKTDRAQQHFTESIYHLTKAFDPMRPVIVNDGWEHTVSDIITLHDYEELGDVLQERYSEHKDDILSSKLYHNLSKSAFADGFAYTDKPVILSEFGGIAFNNDDSGWGYGNKVNTKDEFIKRFDAITTAIKEIPYVCGFCYTQLTDVQQEINGLLDINRKPKIELSVIREINERQVNCRHSIR